MSLQTDYKKRVPDGHFFDPETMQFFKSRIGRAVKVENGDWYFITSEKSPHGNRAYTVRKLTADGVGGIIAQCDFNSLSKYQAEKLLKELTDLN